MKMNKGFTIAVSGKGGVGKTNLSALLIRYLSRMGSVLAVDADPDSNLPQALGVAVNKTVGDVREEITNLPARRPEAADKMGAFERAMMDIVEETLPFDVLVMGRSEGEGCYCVINNILRQAIDSRADNYDFVVVDCEAGLEHLSRRTTRDIDLLIAVTDATMNGILTAKRVQQLSQALHISFNEVMVVANRVTQETRSLLDRMVQEKDTKIAAYIPYDPLMAEFDILGKPVIELPEDSAASIAVTEMCQHLVSCTV
jgi:CO dehydrogenase maturation factor